MADLAKLVDDLSSLSDRLERHKSDLDSQQAAERQEHDRLVNAKEALDALTNKQKKLLDQVGSDELEAFFRPDQCLDVCPLAFDALLIFSEFTLDECFELLTLLQTGKSLPAPVVLLDEPFSALDPAIRADLQTWLRDVLTRVGISAVLVTHDIDEALLTADRVLLLGASGRIVSEAPGLRRLPAGARRNALAAPDGADRRAALYEALRGASPMPCGREGSR